MTIEAPIASVGGDASPKSAVVHMILDRLERVSFGAIIARADFTISAGDTRIGTFRIDALTPTGRPLFVKPQATQNRFTRAFESSCTLEDSVLEMMREVIAARLAADAEESATA